MTTYPLKTLRVAVVLALGAAMLVAAAPPTSAQAQVEWTRTGDDSVIPTPLASALNRPRAATRTDGYSLLVDNIALLDADYPYTISIRSGSDYFPLRDALVAAASDLNRFDPTVRVRAGTVERSAPVRGEILVEVTNASPCPSTALGCAGPQTWEYGTGQKSEFLFVTSGHVWISFGAFQQHYSPAGFRSLIEHELGHVAGLGHYDDLYAGQRQVMHSVNSTTDRYQHGDYNGLGVVHANGRSSPLGDINDAQGAVRDMITVWGWAFDPDAPATALRVDMYLDGPAGAGKQVFAGPANLSRPDVAAVFPGAGSNHGFVTSLAGISPGPHTLYLYAINVGAGKNTFLGQRTVSVPTTPPGSPTGEFGVIGVAGDSVWVYGWTLDPSAPTVPNDVHVYIEDGFGVWKGFDLGPANLSKPGVGAANPGAGDNHGFSAAAKGISPGAHAVAAYAINSGSGTNVLLGISTVTVPTTPTGSPVGVFESAKGEPGGAVRVTGWAIDPSGPTSPTEIHVYVEESVGVWKGFNIGPANLSRPDVGAANPGAGDNHGFSTAVGGITPGMHAVAVYAVNAGPGGTVLLGSFSVRVP